MYTTRKANITDPVLAASTYVQRYYKDAPTFTGLVPDDPLIKEMVCLVDVRQGGVYALNQQDTTIDWNRMTVVNNRAAKGGIIGMALETATAGAKALFLFRGVTGYLTGSGSENVNPTSPYGVMVARDTNFGTNLVSGVQLCCCGVTGGGTASDILLPDFDAFKTTDGSVLYDGVPHAKIVAINISAISVVPEHDGSLTLAAPKTRALFDGINGFGTAPAHLPVADPNVAPEPNP